MAEHLLLMQPFVSSFAAAIQSFVSGGVLYNDGAPLLQCTVKKKKHDEAW